MLGIIGAMEVEVEKLRAKMTETEMKTVAGMNFCRGKLEGKDVVIVRSGIGKVNAGICSQILVDLYQVDGIVNTGIWGEIVRDAKDASLEEVSAALIFTEELPIWLRVTALESAS